MASRKKIRQKAAVSPAAPTAPAVPQSHPAPAAGWAEEPLPPLRRPWAVPTLMAAFFLGSCLTTESTAKSLAMSLMVTTVLSCLVRLVHVRDRLSLPLLAVAAWMLMNGVSAFYAVSGKFALRQFLRMMIGFCCFLLILAWSRRGRDSGRAAASVLTGGTALASLVSIDMLSTRLLSGVVLSFLGTFSDDFALVSRSAVEAGVRMLSLYENPNVFAGISGLGVLLSLGLAVTARRRGERPFHLCCLFLNALAFLLAFSMGASGTVAAAFLAFLLLERRERKGTLLVLMAETLALSLSAAFPIFLTSFDAWDGFQPIPLLCAVGGAAALCLLDRLAGRRLSDLLADRGILLAAVSAALLAAIGAFAALSVTLTGPASLSAGEVLRRAEYPAAGTYTLNLQATGALSVTVESQNQRETMMHTGTVLYSGDARGAEFTVPGDSLVVYFNFRAGEALTLESASFSGGGSVTDLKLRYKLLPGFIANRLQGLFANENAIQRVVFFADGMKLFRRSPVVGLGVGAFENSVQGVQSFFYETKFAHNHYVETLVSTGVVGLVLFIAMLALCALAVWKNLRRGAGADPLSPALGAALLFMALHAGVEVVFSFHFYLPMALGVLGLICLCCGEELAFLPGREAVRGWFVAGLCVLIAVFALFLGLNMKARKTAVTNALGDPYRSLARAAALDFFEKNDYRLSYVVMARDVDREERPEVLAAANRYAGSLARADSNSIPPYLAGFYFATGQPGQAVAVLNKYADYVSANSKTWREAFAILAEWSEAYPEDTTAAALELWEKLQSWNGENMGVVALTEENLAYLDGVLTGGA